MLSSQKLKSWPLSIVGVAMLVIGVVGMALSSQIQKKKYLDNDSNNSNKINEEDGEVKYNEKARLLVGGKVVVLYNDRYDSRMYSIMIIRMM